jgi:hypothetical protein
MMKWVRIIPCAALCAMLVGCEETVVAPVPDDLENPSLTVEHNAILLTFDLVGLTVTADCANDGAGEDLEYVSGTFDTYWWWRITPSGNQLWNIVSDYDTGDPLTAVGQDSGDVWTLVTGEGNSNWVRKAGAPRPVNDHFQANEWYVNQDGEKLHLRQRFTVQRDLDGNVKHGAFVETIRCTGKP